MCAEVRQPSLVTPVLQGIKNRRNFDQFPNDSSLKQYHTSASSPLFLGLYQHEGRKARLGKQKTVCEIKKASEIDT